MVTPHRGYPTVPVGTPPSGRTQLNALAMAVDADVAGLVSGWRLAAVLNYTSSGTFQKGLYAGIKAVEVEVIGGGGGSGYAAATSGAQFSFGVGGAGGAYAWGVIDAGSLSDAETVTVGAGGIAGTSGTPDGGAGGDSAFGAHLTASGGGGGEDRLESTAGSGAGNGSSGGTAAGTGLMIGISGEGLDQVTFTSGYFEHMGALRGRPSGGPYGATRDNSSGPAVGAMSSQSAQAGFGIGSGARGPVRLSSSSAANGAAGSAGRVIVRVYV